jgi:undecaprenyl diphosphate synthase
MRKTIPTSPLKSKKKNNLKDRIDRTRIPRHIGVIMDGNGRWARSRGLTRSQGHEAGASAVERLLEPVKEMGIEVISLYSFSKENWSRPKQEINFLWQLLIKFFKEKLPKIQAEGIRIFHSGDKDELPFAVRKIIERVVKATEKNSGPVLNFCINYGGRQEIVHAVRGWLKSQSAGKKKSLNPSEFNEEAIEKNLYTSWAPNLDLVIRTSGEERISNFLLWQIAYAEIWITPKLWPDFSEEDLYCAILEFQKRQRRFGGI